MHVLFHICEAPVKGSQEIRMEPSEGCLRGAGQVKRRLCENREKYWVWKGLSKNGIGDNGEEVEMTKEKDPRKVICKLSQVN